jgi:sirohydrochlorin cobaltochelatase
MKRVSLIILATVIGLTLSTMSFAMGKEENKKAIVLANFGTSYLSALKAITTIQKEVEKAFPDVKVQMAFTSNIIRKIWHKRQNDKAFLKDHPDVPKEYLYVKGPLATIADLQDEGYRTIVVQPTHIFAGEEYADLSSYVRGLNSITTIKEKYRPFKKLVIGRPALGGYGDVHDYHKDMETAAKVLKDDVARAKKEKAALVYMGHGNEFFSTGIYIEFQQVMRKMYPDVKIFIGTVEGFPSLEDVLTALKHKKVKKVVLKPFMVVAGDHANNDMAGDEGNSWKNRIKKLGIHVTPVLHGLGENLAWARIYVQHIKDAAKDNGIELK